MVTANTTAASCQHCATPIQDLGDSNCPSCGQAWAPAGNTAAAAAAQGATNTAIPATEPKKQNVAGFAKLAVLLFLAVTLLGTFGMAYPGNFFLDVVFRAIGKFVFLGVFQGNLVNAGYGVVLISIASFVFGRVTKK
jgi:uncharacterized membrane protein